MAKGNKLSSANVISHEPGPDLDYRAQCDCRTLSEAQEIMKDRGRHGRAKKHAAGEAKKLAAVAGKKK